MSTGQSIKWHVANSQISSDRHPYYDFRILFTFVIYLNTKDDMLIYFFDMNDLSFIYYMISNLSSSPFLPIKI